MSAEPIPALRRIVQALRNDKRVSYVYVAPAVTMLSQTRHILARPGMASVRVDCRSGTLRQSILAYTEDIDGIVQLVGDIVAEQRKR